MRIWSASLACEVLLIASGLAADAQPISFVGKTKYLNNKKETPG